MTEQILFKNYGIWRVTVICRERIDDERSSQISDEDRRRSTESLPAKPFASSSSSSDDMLDKCASHPNISVPDPKPVKESDPSQESSSSDPLGSSDSVLEQGGSQLGSGKESTDEGVSDMVTSYEGSLDQDSKSSDSTGEESDPGDLKSKATVSTAPSDSETKHKDDLMDIDNTLAEIMSSVHSLELQQKVPPKQPSLRQRPKRPPPPPSSYKHTPDLVLDLPVSQTPSSPKEKREKDSPTLSTAEVFAKSNQSTIKKGMPLARATAASPFTGSQGSKDSAIMVTSMPSEALGGLLQRNAARVETGSLSEKDSTSPSHQITERRSDLSTEKAQPPRPIMIKSRTLPANTRPPLPNRPRTPEHFLSANNRADTPDSGDSVQQTESHPPLSASVSVPLPGMSPLNPPERPRPPPKAAKPQVMKKPAKSPEILRRLREKQEQEAQSSSQAPP